MEVEQLDLRGAICPLGAARASTKLKGLASGAHLLLLVDPGESVASVAQRVKADGHRILEVTRREDHFELLVQRG